MPYTTTFPYTPPARAAAFLLLAAWPAALGAQDADGGSPPAGAAEPVPDAAFAQETPPPNFAALELERSRECVPALAVLDSVGTQLDPLRLRTERLGALHGAVSAEDSLRITPFDRDDPLEREVAEWFERDTELALLFLETEDEALREERAAGRAEILERLREALQDVNRRVEEILGSAEGLDRALQDCRGRMLVRSAVLEACESVTSPVCEAAREGGEANAQFVDDAAELWGLEQLRPWSDPTSLQVTPEGTLGGARTASFMRRGNMTLLVGLEPRIALRDSLSADEVTEWEARLDSMGFTFEHPDVLMAPAMTVELDAPGRLGDETRYVLHFGAEPTADADLLWSAPVPDTRPLRATFFPEESDLVRLAQGDPPVLSAVRPAEDGETPWEVVYAMGLTPIGQPSAVTGLIQYMGDGRLSDDLESVLRPVDAGAEEPAPN